MWDYHTGEEISLLPSEWDPQDLHDRIFPGAPQAFPREFRVKLEEHLLSEGAGLTSRHLNGMHQSMTELGATQQAAGVLRWVPMEDPAIDLRPGIGAEFSEAQPFCGWSLNHWGCNDFAVTCLAAYAVAQDCSIECSKAMQRLAFAKAAVPEVASGGLRRIWDVRRLSECMPSNSQILGRYS
jgi:hypothetical protein